MIRIKLETTATGTTSPVSFTVPEGYSASVARIQPPANNNAGHFQYVLLDADGVAWEHGYGRISGTDFYRSTVIASTNSNAAISLSSGTHTILVPLGGLEGRIAQLCYIAGATVSAGSAATLSFSAVRNTVDGVLDLPGVTAPTLPDDISHCQSLVPYARGFKAHLNAVASTVQAGNMQIRIYDNTANWETIAAATAPTDLANSACSCATPMLNTRSPIPNSSVMSSSDLRCQVHNTGAGSLSVSAVLTLDYYL